MEMRDPELNGVSAEENTINEAAAAATAPAAGCENEDTVAATDSDAGELVPADDDVVTEVSDDVVADEDSDDEASELEPEMTLQKLIETAQEMLNKEAGDISSDDVRHLRQQFNAIHNAMPEPSAAESDEPVATEAADTASEAEIFLGLLAEIRHKKAEWAAQCEVQKSANLDKKKAIVFEIIALAEDTDNVNRTFPRYRELQDEFNAIGEVPATEDTAIWKQFQEARERYSDNLKINKELRDYDFKKNLDSKQLLLDEATALVDEPDVIVAYRRLQELHNKWRQIGPVAKEFREDIWARFKNASAEINKRYQAFFEERKAREAANEAGKQAIIERLEDIDIEAIKSFKGWDEATKIVLEAQAEWRTFGFASKRVNKALFACYREICDKFFAAKAEFFRNTRDELSQNLARKTALCEKAEALQDSEDWKAATEAFVAMQKEWKTIGAVAKKHSDAVWHRFVAACDHFFDRKKKAGADTRHTENANLKAKREIIAALEAISPDTPRDEAIKALRQLQAQWNEIGHVPYKEKEKIYEDYRSKVNALRKALDIKESRARMERFENAVAELGDDDNKLYRERERLVRVLEAKRNELRTLDNNIGFLSSKSKSGESMLREFARKADRLKADITDLEGKIKLVDSKLA